MFRRYPGFPSIMLSFKPFWTWILICAECMEYLPTFTINFVAKSKDSIHGAYGILEEILKIMTPGMFVKRLIGTEWRISSIKTSNCVKTHQVATLSLGNRVGLNMEWWRLEIVKGVFFFKPRQLAALKYVQGKICLVYFLFSKHQTNKSKIQPMAKLENSWRWRPKWLTFCRKYVELEIPWVLTQWTQPPRKIQAFLRITYFM